MRIAKVHIENFRSIKELEFSPGPFCVLIGENNAGKSNILRALNLILGESWPNERSFSEEDFYNQDTSKDIVIQVFFDEEIEDKPNGFPVKIAGFELRCKAYKRRVGNKPAGTLKVDYTCLDIKGNYIKYPANQLKSGQKYNGQWITLRVSNDRREQIPFIYVDVLRGYDRQTPSSRWSVLRKLFNEVNTEFLNDKKKEKITLPDGTIQELTRKEAFEYAVKDAYKYLRTNSFIEIENLLAANAMEQMGIEPGEGDVSLHFESHDPTHAYKSLQLYIDQMGITSPAGEVGAGLQSAIVVGIFRTYEELKKEGAIFAIEEPEVFLHPQKARYFESVLRGLAEGGNQVFITTHSPVYVKVYDPESVAVVRRTQERGTWVTQTEKVSIADNERQALRLMTEFDTQRNELFFARRVMLVEGNTEKVALPLIFRALGIDINKVGISIIECGGKTKIPLFARVSKALSIPFVVLVDHDIKEIKEEWSERRKDKEQNDNKNHRRWNAEIEKICPPDRLFYLYPNFEGELGLPSSEEAKVDQASQRFSNASENDVPECLKKPIFRLLED